MGDCPSNTDTLLNEGSDNEIFSSTATEIIKLKVKEIQLKEKKRILLEELHVCHDKEIQILCATY